MPLRATVCPKCGADAPNATAGAKHTCGFCGTTSVVEPPMAASGRTSVPCPRCGAPLFEGKTSNTTLHGCGGCGGVWLDNDASRRIVRALDTPILELARVAGRSGAGKGVDRSSPARCPFDGTELARTTVKEVEVDVCPAHGTWFDAGEVERIAHAFERARLALAGGPTHNYAADADRSARNLKLLSAILNEE